MENEKVWNVLVFPGGTENGLEICKSLRFAKEVKLFSVSSVVKNHAEFMYKNHFVISDIYSKNCLNELNQIIKKNSIDFIFPANSYVIDFLIESRDNICTKIILPDNDIVRTIRSKKKTYSLFKNKIITPGVYKSIDSIEKYPIFVKPDSSYGSQGAHKINSLIELRNLELDLTNHIMCEFLPGDEFTVECFSKKDVGILYSLARTRERIRMGTSMHSEAALPLIQEETSKIANIIFDELNIDGLWFFQMKYNSDNKLCLLEIESRVAGTMAFSRVNGINLPLLNLYLTAGKDVKINKQKYDVIIDRSLANRYKTNINFEIVYIDLDDTIICKNVINTSIISFLYQCINKGKRIVLLSKSLEREKNEYLKKHRIIQIFDEIIWLNENDSKADFIKDKNSIFIDDSFSQRLEVEQKKGIPTFEPNMIEILLDDRSE